MTQAFRDYHLFKAEGDRIGREGMSHRALQAVLDWASGNQGLKATMVLAGRLKAIATMAKSDDYWSEQVDKGVKIERDLTHAKADPAQYVATAKFTITKASSALDEIAAERQRQISAEGWTHEHDDSHHKGELARAAACYAWVAQEPTAFREAKKTTNGTVFRRLWPWDFEWWKPSDRRRDLIKAGALILAEIERLDRAAASETTEGGQCQT